MALLFSSQYSILNNMYMVKIKQDVKKERVDAIYALIGRHREITIRRVAEKAGLNVDSVYANMRNYQVSLERLDKLETALHELIDESINRNKKAVAV